jgi:hypothetical protein
LVKTRTQSHQGQSEDQGQGHSVANEEISESLLFRCWNETCKPVNEIIRLNKESDTKYPELYVHYFNYSEPMDVRQKRRWVASCTNKKTGEFITLDQLVAAGKISEAECKLYGNKLFPRRELIHMTRHQTDDRREWLIRTETWFGLTEIGGTASVPVSDIDYARQVNIDIESVPQDPSVEGAGSGSPHVKIYKVGDCVPAYYGSDKIFLTPFIKENVLEAMQKAQRPSQRSLHGRISLILNKYDAHNPITAPDLETFVNADFDELWTKLTQPTPQININSHDLLNYLKSYEGSKNKDAYQ